MTTQSKRAYVEEDISEQTVHDYLAADPDFFERHPDLLGMLRLPHAKGGTVSLVERQVSMLRQKEFKLQRKLKDLIEVARANDLLAAKIHELTLQLIAAKDLAATIAAIEVAMRSGFEADEAVLVLFADPTQFDDVESGRFFRVLERADDRLRPFATFLGGRGPRCGKIRDAQLEFLFPGATEDVGSVAMMPLGNKADLGFLAIGSSDSDRFHAGMSMDFLARVADLISCSLRRY